MSTSPSWFDQEKFSRLVKKVGPKAAPVAPVSVVRSAAPRSPEKETRRLQRSLEEIARSTPAPPVPEFPIRAPDEPTGEGEPAASLFPPPMPVPEPRSVSPLARRTTSLPNLKPIFEYEKKEEEKADEPSSEEPSWPSLHEEAPVVFGEHEDLQSQIDELTRERDEAREEAATLRAQVQEADEIIQAAGASGGNMEELSRITEERDGARRDYASLREEFETLKAEQKQNENVGAAMGSSPDADALRAEVNGLEATVDNLKKELDAMQAQFTRARDDASAAQRGLALSQKALQETRDALREASEGLSQSKASAESMKNECASLVQQNMTLQTQYDQLSRELAAARAKGAVRS